MRLRHQHRGEPLLAACSPSAVQALVGRCSTLRLRSGCGASGGYIRRDHTKRIKEFVNE